MIMILGLFHRMYPLIVQKVTYSNAYLYEFHFKFQAINYNTNIYRRSRVFTNEESLREYFQNLIFETNST